MSESMFYHITREGKLVLLSSLEEGLAPPPIGGFAWFDYCQPTREELSLLIDPLELHPLSIEDCFDENQIPKIDDYPRYAFILFNTFSYSQGELSIGEVDLFIGAGYLVSVSSNETLFRQVHQNIEHLLVVDPKRVRQGPAFFLHAILDYIVDQKIAVIETMEEELDHAEEVISSDLANFNPATLLHLRRNLLALRKSLFHEREVFMKIIRKDCPFIPEKVLFLYRDIFDHLSIFLELIETSRDIVTSLREMYLSLLNNQMAQTSNRTNQTVRRLTFITTIFMPLTLLTGIGGMSEWSMMTGPDNWRWSYPAFLLGMLALGITSYFMLKRLDKKDREPEMPSIGQR